MRDALLKVMLKRISFEADRVNSYTLQAVDGGPLPAFSAGAHIDLYLEPDLVRSYSLTNDPADSQHYIIAVKNEPNGRGGSAFVHDRLKVGDILSISSPRNNFVFDEGDHASIFIVGGIGVTPILSMLQRANTLGRRWTLHYASRRRADAAFLEDIQQLANGNRINAVFDHEAGGVPLNLAAIIATASDDTHLYCCGPLPMLESFKAATRSKPSRLVHLEYFSTDQEAATEGGFEVRLAKTGRTIAIAPGKTILAALLDAGIPVSHACSEGTCGTCETRVLDGLPDHRDVYLTDDEHAANKQIMICCSGSKTPVLVLEL